MSSLNVLPLMPMQTTAERVCATCAHWRYLYEIEHPTGRPQSNGECRRYPPQLPAIKAQVTGAGPYGGVSPETLGGEYCGEWKSKGRAATGVSVCANLRN